MGSTIGVCITTNWATAITMTSWRVHIGELSSSSTSNTSRSMSVTSAEVGADTPAQAVVQVPVTARTQERYRGDTTKILRYLHTGTWCTSVRAATGRYTSMRMDKMSAQNTVSYEKRAPSTTKGKENATSTASACTENVVSWVILSVYQKVGECAELLALDAPAILGVTHAHPHQIDTPAFLTRPPLLLVTAWPTTYRCVRKADKPAASGVWFWRRDSDWPEQRTWDHHCPEWLCERRQDQHRQSHATDVRRPVSPCRHRPLLVGVFPWEWPVRQRTACDLRH